jgi:hypothetical protein
MRFVLAFLLLGFPAAWCFAQVMRPDVKAGDRWTYQRADKSGKPAASYDLAATYVGRNAIHALRSEEPGQETDAVYTRDWNVVAMDQRVFYPHSGSLEFPLQQGKRYELAYRSVFARDARSAKPAGKSRAKLTVIDEEQSESIARVIGFEDVAVPAGTFRALRIEVTGEFARLEGRLKGRLKDTIWYVPEVKRWVKWVHERGTLAGTEDYSEELVRFSVQ